MSIGDEIKKQLELSRRNDELFRTALGQSKSPLEEITKSIPQFPDSQTKVLTDAISAAVSPTVAQRETDTIRKAIAEATAVRPLPGIQDAVKSIANIQTQWATALQDAVAPITQLQSELAKAAKVAFEPFVQFMTLAQRFSDEVRKATEPLARIRTAFAALPPEEISAFQKALAGLSSQFRLQWDVEERPVFSLFTKLGLVGLESYLTRSELLRILQISKEKGRSAVQQHIFKKFRAKRYRVLNRAARSWWRLPYMAKRKKTVLAALRAHKSRHFELAIPALLPLIDGLADEIVNGHPATATPASGKKGKKGRNKTIYAKDAVAQYNTAEAELWSECAEQVVCTLVYRDYDFRNAKRPPSSVNRHGILHGRVVSYGSELNSYRVILLLDLMVKIAIEKMKAP